LSQAPLPDFDEDRRLPTISRLPALIVSFAVDGAIIPGAASTAL
jgi:hypothetical protein